MVKLSAALIVRDEENHLGACLQSIAKLVDEIVIADTGSRDRTREIAFAHGARVLDYQWHDDFAAARNYAIDQASGDWILYIDADERARSYDRQILRSRAWRSAAVRVHGIGSIRAPDARLTPSIACSGATGKYGSAAPFTRPSCRTWTGSSPPAGDGSGPQD